MTECDIEKLARNVIDGLADAGYISDDIATSPDRFEVAALAAKKVICDSLPTWIGRDGVVRGTEVL